MRTNTIYQGIALLAMALTTAACQNELKEENNEPNTGKKITMTIHATLGTTAQTRTSYEDNLGEGTLGSVGVKWEANEQIQVLGYANGIDAAFDTEPTLFQSEPTSWTDGTTLTFKAENVPSADRYLAIYPVGNYNADAQAIITSFTGQTQDCAEPMAHLKNYDLMIGTPATEGSYDNFIFAHAATMIRFVLNVPSSETITQVSLSSTKKQYSEMYTLLSSGELFVQKNEDDLVAVDAHTLNISNHTPSATPLKAYMMIPPDVVGDLHKATDVLTVTVKTKSNSIYKGELTVGTNTLFEAGKCYTLIPTLTVLPEINVPAIEEGKLGDELKNITSLAPTQTDMTLTGKANADDLTALAAFLNPTDGVGKAITTLDLSKLEIASTGNDTDDDPISTVAGFAGCETLTKVILPEGATAIADDAFAGCSALTTVIQNEPTTLNTRARISSLMKTIGARAFKGTAIDVMYLHANITTIGENAFTDCTKLVALVFEGTKTVGTATADLKIGADIISGTTPNYLKVFLPKITEANKAVATSYKTKLGKDTFYNYKYTDYDTANDNKKLTPANYTPLPDAPGATSPGLPGGSQLGDK